MTRTEASPPSDPTPGDPRHNFAHVVSVTGSLIAETDPAAHRNATPCTEYDVETLIAHLVAVLRRVAAVARGEDPFSVPQQAEAPSEGTWHDAWNAAAHEVREAWTDPSVLERALTLPFAVLPGAIALTMYCGEVAVHAWDLAQGTDRAVEFDDALLHDALEGAKIGLPAAGRGVEVPFDPVVDVAPTRPVVEQLAGWMGRPI